MPNCPSCGSEVGEGLRFCGHCGAAVDRTAAPTETSFRDGSPGPSPVGGARGAQVSSESADRARFLPGTVVANRYRVVGLLGRGGMGEVYRADDLKLGQPVALKFLPAGLEPDQERLNRFLGEVRMSLRVTHPNVCRVHDIGEVDGEHFISMEYVDGEDLASLIRRIGRLPQDKAVEMARQLCAGLHAAHEEGILHRDLKPANVMLDGRGRIKITDFGLAGLQESFKGTDIGVGTPAYMAPEQISSREVTARSESYARGLVLYEMFTGKPAFDAKTRAEVICLRQQTSVTSPTAHVEDLDPAIERVIMRCLAKDPEGRPISALAVAAALPGGDPLAAALAAGETPSPELVAAAGESEAMHIGPAAAIGLLIAAELVCLVFLTSAVSVHGYVPLDKPPQALEDRAREVLAKLGYTDEPADTAFGFDRNTPYLNWLKENDSSPNRSERLREPRPGGMYFWYRQSPGRFRPFSGWASRGFVGSVNPPWQVPGEAYASLDLAGRLRRFYVIPGTRFSSPDEAPKPVEEADWPMLFDLAGLNFESFVPANPRWTFAFRVDERMAWSGVYPEAPDIAIQVEAGLIEGKPSYFRFVNPWGEPKPAPTIAADQPSSLMRLARFVERWQPTASFVIILSIVTSACFLASRRRHLAWGDLHGALPIAGFAYWATLLWTLLNGERLLPRTANELMQALATATFMAVVVWFCYLVLEPFARRLWPTMLVAWTRLVSGRIRDPLVGKSILVGTVGGSLNALLHPLSHNAPGWLGDPLLPAWFNFHLAGAVHHSLSDATMHVVIAVFLGFALLLLLILLRFLLRRQWLAAVVFLLIAPVMVGGRDFDLLPWGPLSVALAALVILLVLLRFGVLALIACLCCDMMLQGAPLSPNLTAWYAHATLVPLGFVAAITCYGLYAATYGRPKFQTEFPES